MITGAVGTSTIDITEQDVIDGGTIAIMDVTMIIIDIIPTIIITIVGIKK